MTEDAAVREWSNLAYWIARDYHLPGAGRDDVKQEALIALWYGLRSHDPARAPLRTWLASCIRKRLGSAVRDACRLKHGPLNDAVTLAEGEKGPGGTLVPLQARPGWTPAPSASVAEILARLTPLEQRAVVGVACGMEYAEIGPAKTVDNALHRARRKLAA